MSTKPKQQSILHHVDLSEAWDTSDMRDLIFKRLQELGLDSLELVYMGFDGGSHAGVRSRGVFRVKDMPKKEFIFCSTTADLNRSDASGENAISIALGYKKPGLAVYDAGKLEKSPIDYAYLAKEELGLTFRDALVAVFILKNVDRYSGR